jgi:pentatricopeptide repeat domain-containing protein 1
LVCVNLQSLAGVTFIAHAHAKASNAGDASQALKIHTNQINELGKRRFWGQALQLFHSMQQKGVVPNVFTNSALISACQKGKQPELAVEVFQAMQRQGVVPDVITCNALICAVDKGKQPERAPEVFEVMHRQRMTADVITYSALISACEKSTQPEQALEVS